MPISPGLQVGTMTYTCPEIVTNRPYNEKADVWSLGCILYHMLMARPPFDASNPFTLAAQIVEGAYAPVADPPSPAPPYTAALKNLVPRLLTHDCAARPTVAAIASLVAPVLLDRLDAAAILTQVRIPGLKGRRIVFSFLVCRGTNTRVWPFCRNWHSAWTCERSSASMPRCSAPSTRPRCASCGRRCPLVARPTTRAPCPPLPTAVPYCTSHTRGTQVAAPPPVSRVRLPIIPDEPFKTLTSKSGPRIFGGHSSHDLRCRTPCERNYESHGQGLFQPTATDRRPLRAPPHAAAQAGVAITAATQRCCWGQAPSGRALPAPPLWLGHQRRCGRLAVQLVQNHGQLLCSLRPTARDVLQGTSRAN